jgi:hypothetical protein
VLCRNYDYSSDAKKLKLFPATLKDVALRWFMGLGTNAIKTWDEMRKTFLEKYNDYCTNRGMREEMFKMTQKEEESLEDYLERFHYTVKREKQNHLDLDTLKVILLRGIRDEWIDVLNLMGKGDISHLTYPKFVTYASISLEESPNMVRDLGILSLGSTNQPPVG